ncbi:MAG: hypothetical protein QG623_20 [Patescibacteria group bacterium]|nr:hypothetical protein [Patescibacteria group bacterium]
MVDLSIIVMKAFLKPSIKLTKRELVGLAIISMLTFSLILVSMMVLVLRSTGVNLKEENRALDTKVSSLQGDLRSIGEKLSGIANEADDTGPATAVTPLTKNVLIATPGESTLSLDTPAGWVLSSENRLRSGDSAVGAQSEDIDLLTIPNYQVTRVVESFTIKSGQAVFLVFIRSSDDNQGYLSLSFCNPDIGTPCSFRGADGKYVFILGHGYQDGDQFVRDMDFNTAEGIKLITDFKVMMKSLEIS